GLHLRRLKGCLRSHAISAERQARGKQRNETKQRAIHKRAVRAGRWRHPDGDPGVNSSVCHRAIAPQSAGRRTESLSSRGPTTPRSAVRMFRLYQSYPLDRRQALTDRQFPRQALTARQSANSRAPRTTPQQGKSRPNTPVPRHPHEGTSQDKRSATTFYPETTCNHKERRSPTAQNPLSPSPMRAESQDRMNRNLRAPMPQGFP